MKVLIAIVGPTASGKSNLALKLAKKFNGEIICADSRAIYKGMLIGTASPCLNHKFKILNPKIGFYSIEDVSHYLLHFINPDETFTVAQFQKIAYQIIEDILKRNKIPFLVGGTGLYIDAVTKGLVIPKAPPNLALREKLEKEGTENLYQKLQKLDPIAASKILPTNKRRIIRALEVCLTTGYPLSKQQKIKKPPYRVLAIGIQIPREELYKRIDKRVDEMIEGGLINEVKKLLQKGYSPNLSSMSGLGYKQIANWLLYQKDPITYHLSPKSLNEAIYQIKRDTRHFARRQISWFKRDKSIKWVKNAKEAEKLIKEFLSCVSFSSAQPLV